MQNTYLRAKKRGILFWKGEKEICVINTFFFHREKTKREKEEKYQKKKNDELIFKESLEEVLNNNKESENDPVGKPLSIIFRVSCLNGTDG